MTATMTDLFDGYTTDALARSIGASYRVVDYWARTGVLEPTRRPASGSGSQRSYSREDVVVGRALFELARHGARGETLRPASAALRDQLARGQWAGVVYVGLDGELGDRAGRAGWALDLDVLGT